MSESSPAVSVVKKTRKYAASVSDKIAALKAQLALAEAEEKAARKEQAAIVGAALIQAMTENPEFRAAALVHIRAKVKSPRDKATIADLLL